MTILKQRTTSLECPPRPPPQLTDGDPHRYPPNPSPSPSATVVSSNPHASHGVIVALSDSSREERDAVAFVDRHLMRTPDPTPSEEFLLTHKARECNWAKILDWRRYKNPRVFWPIAATATLVSILILFIVFKNRLVDKMRPFADWMHNTPGGWLIPIGLLIAMSFPPLFGHEIVAILCGVIWGIWIGFGIVAGGTALGELANFYVYKWWCGARGRKLEESRLNWALLAEVVRTGGLMMPLLMRLTYIPGHFLTAVFSTCGMGFWIFTASAVLSLPKQLAVVFIGVSGANGEKLSASTAAIKFSVIGAAVLLTFFAMWYIYSRMDEVKGPVIYARRKRRQAKLLAAAGYHPDLAYGSKTRVGQEIPEQHTTQTQAHADDIELESQEIRTPRPRHPLPPRSPPARNASASSAVSNYPTLTVDDEGSRSPLHSSSVEASLEQASDVQSRSPARSATPILAVLVAVDPPAVSWARAAFISARPGGLGARRIIFAMNLKKTTVRTEEMPRTDRSQRWRSIHRGFGEDLMLRSGN